jgi:hypothetical protein
VNSDTNKSPEKKSGHELMILYIGVDKRYCESLQEKLATNYTEKGITFRFRKFHQVAQDNHVAIVNIILKEKPDLALIDYSFQPDCLLKVTHILRQIKKDLPILALFEHQTNFDVVKRSIRSGILLNQLKSGEDNLNTMYSMGYLTIRDNIAEPEIAKYQIREGLFTKVIENAPVNYYTMNGFRVESYQTFKLDEEIDVGNKFPEEIMPSKKFVAAKAGEIGEHHYDRPHWAEFEYQYLDPIVISPRASALEKANMQEEQAKRLKQIEEEVKPAFKEWFEEELAPKSDPQNVKILIIDHRLESIKTSKQWIEETLYSIQLKINVQDLEDHLKHFRPILIAFNYEVAPEQNEDGSEIEPLDYNDSNALKSLIQNIQSIEDYAPYIITFNDQGSACKKVQQELGLGTLMASQDKIDLNTIIKFAQVYENKNKEKIENEQKGKVYMNKDDEMALVQFKHVIQIVNVNEVAFEFTSKLPFQLYQTYQLEEPVETYFTIVPHRPNSQFANDSHCYRALFHSYNDEQKKAIRKFIISKK